ncbi:MAG: hypothetical protein FWD61_18790 [Phycisphaerales bacterium]|nr:hypothetical protein [Phycisphaerales bacterium]
MTRVYEEIVDFLAGGPTSGGVAAWQPSEQARERVAELIAAEKSGTISVEERGELNHYLELEHLMRLAKARAHRRGREGGGRGGE